MITESRDQEIQIGMQIDIDASLAEQFKTKLTKFSHMTILHHRFEQAFRNLSASLLMRGSASEGGVIAVVGGSGIGKSSLCRTICRVKNAQIEAINPHSPGRIVFVEVPKHSIGKFNWRDIYRRILRQLGDPTRNDKLPIEALWDADFSSEQWARAVKGKCDTADLQSITETLLRAYGVYAIVFDEAQHFAAVRTDAAKSHQLDQLKSLASLAEAPVVLFGTYELQQMLDGGEQLHRRTEVIHFEGYGKEPGELGHFLAALEAVASESPIRVEVDLASSIELIYDHTLGRVGIWSGWLQKANADALKDSRDRIDRSDLLRTAFNRDVLAQFSQDADAFNRFLKGVVYEGPTEQVKIPVERHRPRARPGLRKSLRDPVHLS